MSTPDTPNSDSGLDLEQKLESLRFEAPDPSLKSRTLLAVKERLDGRSAQHRPSLLWSWWSEAVLLTSIVAVFSWLSIAPLSARNSPSVGRADCGEMSHYLGFGPAAIEAVDSAVDPRLESQGDQSDRRPFRRTFHDAGRSNTTERYYSYAYCIEPDLSRL